jgi:hypothetical protein
MKLMNCVVGERYSCLRHSIISVLKAVLIKKMQRKHTNKRISLGIPFKE